MKRRYTATAVVLIAIAGVLLWLKWKRDEPRRESGRALHTLARALRSGDSGQLLNSVVVPQAVQSRTAAEQAEFLTKALADEISPEGLAVLQRDGAFGPLTNIFPTEAEAWAGQAGVKAEDCVAFKLERNGLRAEVVLAKLSTLNSQPSTAFKIVRCNNVKQLAAANQP